MRTKSKDREHFWGTHKGCDIQITREPRGSQRAFYIIVTAPDGGHLYDGWSPEGICTMAEAKREALGGAGLRPRGNRGAGTSEKEGGRG